MDQGFVFLLIGAAMVLGLIGVLIDRLNFQQRRFSPKAVAVDHKGRAARDRTGAHIIDLDPDDPDDLDDLDDLDGGGTDRQDPGTDDADEADVDPTHDAR